MKGARIALVTVPDPDSHQDSGAGPQLRFKQIRRGSIFELFLLIVAKKIFVVVQILQIFVSHFAKYRKIFVT
jgi:hypothetical protein